MPRKSLSLIMFTAAGLISNLSVWSLDTRDVDYLLLRTGFGQPLSTVDIASAAADAGAANPARLLSSNAQVEATVSHPGTDPASFTPGDFQKFSDSLASMNRKQAVAAIIDSARTSPVVSLPAWSSAELPLPPVVRGLNRAEAEAHRREFRLAEAKRARELQAWWIGQMIASDSPFAERMVLFWQNHFTSSLQKVGSPELLLRQQLLIRKFALGDFAGFVHAIAHDPAMIIYLDNQTNSRGRPNENFARELMELFTLGEGNYTEDDVKAAARAFTGWRVDRKTGTFQFVPRLHDAGSKTFLGRTGNWNGDDIINIILKQNRTALFITGKLWREFVSPTPDAAEVARIAEDFRHSGYDIKVLMQALLESDSFWSAESRGTLVKSPVELTVGMVRDLRISDIKDDQLAAASRKLGQDLFNPLSVKGWPTGADWISSDTLLTRDRVISGLLRQYERQRRGSITAAQRLELRKEFLSPAYELE